MNNNITTYVPVRNSQGRFKSLKWRKLARKTITYQLIILSILLNLFFAHKLYVVTCSAGGHFMTAQKCDELASLQADSQELARLHTVDQNPDIFK